VEGIISADAKATFVRLDQWLGAAPAAPDDPLAEAAGRFLTAYGPATPRTFREWFRLERDEAEAAFGRLALDAVEVEGREALRTGKISLLIEPGPPAVFHFDETRPDSRIARLEADDALQRSAGRKDLLEVRSEKVTEKGRPLSIIFIQPSFQPPNTLSNTPWRLRNRRPTPNGRS